MDFDELLAVHEESVIRVTCNSNILPHMSLFNFFDRIV